MPISCADAFMNHVAENLPNFERLKVMNLYMLGKVLDGEYIGQLVGEFIVSCWQAQTAPVIMIKGAGIRERLAKALGNYLSAFEESDEYGVYFVDVKNDATREILKRELDFMRMWFVSTE